MQAKSEVPTMAHFPNHTTVYPQKALTAMTGLLLFFKYGGLDL